MLPDGLSQDCRTDAPLKIPLATGASSPAGVRCVAIAVAIVTFQAFSYHLRLEEGGHGGVIEMPPPAIIEDRARHETLRSLTVCKKVTPKPSGRGP